MQADRAVDDGLDSSSISRTGMASRPQAQATTGNRAATRHTGREVSAVGIEALNELTSGTTSELHRSDLPPDSRALATQFVDTKHRIGGVIATGLDTNERHTESADLEGNITRAVQPKESPPELNLVILAQPALVAQENPRRGQREAAAAIRECLEDGREANTRRVSAEFRHRYVSALAGEQELVHVPLSSADSRRGVALLQRTDPVVVVHIAHAPHIPPEKVHEYNVAPLLRADSVVSHDVHVWARAATKETSMVAERGGLTAKLDSPRDSALRRAASLIARDVGKEGLANTLAARHVHRSSNRSLATPRNGHAISPTPRSGAALLITSDSAGTWDSQRQDTSVAGYAPAASRTLAQNLHVVKTETLVSNNLGMRKRRTLNAPSVPAESVSAREGRESICDVPCRPTSGKAFEGRTAKEGRGQEADPHLSATMLAPFATDSAKEDSEDIGNATLRHICQKREYPTHSARSDTFRGFSQNPAHFNPCSENTTHIRKPGPFFSCELASAFVTL
jgi:hypothetical protein